MGFSTLYLYWEHVYHSTEHILRALTFTVYLNNKCAGEKQAQVPPTLH